VATKPKSNDKNPQKDKCGTPSYALTPLLPYIPKDWIVWESASGEGLLADALEINGYQVIRSDILTGQNYFDDRNLPSHYDIQITNVPFSIKYKWLQRAYQLGKPFALLMPSDVLFAGKEAQPLFQKYGCEILLPDKRTDFKMPNKGWGGTAQMHTSWFTWGLNIGQLITFVKIHKPRKPKSDVQMVNFASQPKIEQLVLF